jgi:hypothetical protein
MKSLLSQGAEADRSGEVGQQMFEAFWRGFKIPIVGDHRTHHEPQIFPRHERLLIRQPPIEFRYRNARADYLYKDYPRNLDVLFEIRSQIGGGTTDEKLLSTVETLAGCTYPVCCLVLFGNGFRGWVRTAALHRARELSRGNKRIKVIDGAVGDVLYRHLTHLVEHGDFRPDFS